MQSTTTVLAHGFRTDSRTSARAARVQAGAEHRSIWAALVAGLKGAPTAAEPTTPPRREQPVPFC